MLQWAITGTNQTGGIFLRLCGKVLSDPEGYLDGRSWLYVLEDVISVGN